MELCEVLLYLWKIARKLYIQVNLARMQQADYGPFAMVKVHYKCEFNSREKCTGLYGYYYGENRFWMKMYLGIWLYLIDMDRWEPAARRRLVIFRFDIWKCRTILKTFCTRFQIINHVCQLKFYFYSIKYCNILYNFLG